MPSKPDPAQLLREGHDLFFAEPPDYSAAAKRFEGVVELCPTWAEGHVWLGSAYEELKEFDCAAQHWQIACKLDPADSRPLINLGVLRSRQGRYKEAIRLIKEGLALKPHYGYADAKLYLAEAFVGARRIKEAKQQWREILELEPMYPSYEHPMETARRSLRLHGEKE